MAEVNKNITVKTIKAILFYLFMAIAMLWILIPFLIIVCTSLISSVEINSTMSFLWFPKEGIDFSAYKSVLVEDIFASTEIPTLVLGFINTLWIAIITVVCKLFFSGLAAYGYSKLNFKGKEKFFILELATMMIPTACMVMTSYMYYYTLGWTDSFLPIVIPGLFGSATIIFFLRGFFDGIPNELIEAAAIDGLGTFMIYIRIMLPLSVPAFVAQFIFCFAGSYNSYTGPMLYLTKDTQVTLQLALSNIQGSYPYDENVKCAAAVVGLVPLIVVYITCQKFFLDGLTVGGGKE